VTWLAQSASCCVTLWSHVDAPCVDVGSVLATAERVSTKRSFALVALPFHTVSDTAGTHQCQRGYSGSEVGGQIHALNNPS